MDGQFGIPRGIRVGLNKFGTTTRAGLNKLAASLRATKKLERTLQEQHDQWNSCAVVVLRARYQ